MKNKTQPNKTINPTNYLKIIEDKQQQADCLELIKIFKKQTGKNPIMWGGSIIGFDEYEYKRKDGSEHRYLKTGFAPRKGKISIYLMCSLDHMQNLLNKLGKYKRGVGCLYVKKLEDIDVKVLEKMIKETIKSNKLVGQ